MPVIAIKTELKCKLCRSDHRVEIDSMLELRSLRQKNESGETVNLAYVLRALAQDYAIDNPTAENVKVHWQKHCEQVSQAKAEEQEQLREDILAKLESGELEMVDADDHLALIISVNHYELRERLRKGEKTGVTIDHSLKAIDARTRRKHNEKAEQLFDALGGAIAHAMGGSEVRGELPAPDEIAGDSDDGVFEDA